MSVQATKRAGDPLAVRAEENGQLHFSECEVALRALDVLIPNWNDIARELNMNPSLSPIIPQFARAARRELGPDIQLSLELYRDPEFDDQYLTLYARMTEYRFGILHRLEAISDPFDDILDAAGGNLLLTTDFRPPRR